MHLLFVVHQNVGFSTVILAYHPCCITFQRIFVILVIEVSINVHFRHDSVEQVAEQHRFPGTCRALHENQSRHIIFIRIGESIGQRAHNRLFRS